MPSSSEQPKKSESTDSAGVIKYPRTEHLFDTGGTATTNDDLVVSEHSLRTILDHFCHSGRPVIVEEKVDGANLGLRVVNDQLVAQNRSHYISSGDHAQFSMLQPWLNEHAIPLMELLGSGHLILYGEWCVARHSIRYDRLPGYFVAFDLFDINAGKFYSRSRFHAALRCTGIPAVPTIGVRTFGDSDNSNTGAEAAAQTGKGKKKATKGKPKKAPRKTKSGHDVLSNLKSLLETQSSFRAQGTVEGVVLRQDDGDWMERKFKLVRPDFVAGCANGHWLRRAIEKQIVDYDFALSYLEQCYVFAEEESPSVQSFATPLGA